MLGKEMKKGKEKRRKITLNKGEKALKCIFLGYKLKKLIVGVKNFISKEGGRGNDQNAQYISLGKRELPSSSLNDSRRGRTGIDGHKNLLRSNLGHLEKKTKGLHSV